MNTNAAMSCMSAVVNSCIPGPNVKIGPRQSGSAGTAGYELCDNLRV